MIGSRLSDPKDAMAGVPEWLDKVEATGTTPKEEIERWRALSAKTTLHDLQEKISSTMTRLFRKPVNGGNPFLFALQPCAQHAACVNRIASRMLLKVPEPTTKEEAEWKI